MAAAHLRRIARLGAPLTRPFSGTRFLPLWAVLEYRGRRSGRAYATPVAIRRTPDGFVIPMPFGTGFDVHLVVLEARPDRSGRPA